MVTEGARKGLEEGEQNRRKKAKYKKSITSPLICLPFRGIVIPSGRRGEEAKQGDLSPASRMRQ
jgi:hypothetical protein